MKRHSAGTATVRGLAVVALLATAALLISDGLPGVPVGPHRAISALPLLLVAAAYLGHQARRPELGLLSLAKAALVSVAFLLWAAYQAFPTLAHASLLNDGAIAMFTLDAIIVVFSRSGTIMDTSSAPKR